MQVRQDRAFRFDPRDPFQRLIEMEMARMRSPAQRVDDPNVKAGKRRNAVRWQAFDVGGVSDIAKAEPERGDVAVVLQDGQEFDRAALPLYGDRLAGDQALFDGDRGIFAAWRRHKAISEAGVYRTRCRLIQIDIDPPAFAHE